MMMFHFYFVRFFFFVWMFWPLRALEFNEYFSEYFPTCFFFEFFSAKVLYKCNFTWFACVRARLYIWYKNVGRIKKLSMNILNVPDSVGNHALHIGHTHTQMLNCKSQWISMWQSGSSTSRFDIWYSCKM